MIKGIEHFGLVAEDVDSLSRWYCDTFGMHVALKTATGATFLAARNGVMIEVYARRRDGDRGYDNYTSGWRHVAILVEGFDEELARLRERGVEIAADPVVNESMKLVLFRDPEGNLGHLIERAPPLTA